MIEKVEHRLVVCPSNTVTTRACLRVPIHLVPMQRLQRRHSMVYSVLLAAQLPAADHTIYPACI